MSFLYDLAYQLILVGCLGCFVLVFILLLSWAWKNGYLQYVPFYNNLKEAMVQQATNNGMDMISMITNLQQQLFAPSTAATVSGFELGENNNYLTGRVKFALKDYNLVLPYNPRLAQKLKTKKVYLKLNDGNLVEITQPPGTLYYLSAEDMAGSEIIVKDLTNKTIYKVTGSQKLTDLKELTA